MENNGDALHLDFGFPSGVGFPTNGLISSPASRDGIYAEEFTTSNTSLRCIPTDSSAQQQISDACPDVITMHTIDLLHYHREVSKHLAYFKNESSGKSIAQAASEKIPDLPNCILKYRRPGDIKNKNKVSASAKRRIKAEKTDADATGACLFPELKSKNIVLSSFNSGIPDIPKENTLHGIEGDSEFVQGIGKLPIKIPKSIAWKILRKSVGIIFAHAGYELIGKNMLDTITDIAQDYLVRICSVLRKNEDKRVLTNHTVFVDTVEQTCYDIGLGSMTSLHYFYQSRIVDYHGHLMKKCQEVTKEYRKHIEMLNAAQEREVSKQPKDDAEDMDLVF